MDEWDEEHKTAKETRRLQREMDAVEGQVNHQTGEDRRPGEPRRGPRGFKGGGHTP